MNELLKLMLNAIWKLLNIGVLDENNMGIVRETKSIKVVIVLKFSTTDVYYCTLFSLSVHKLFIVYD